MTIEESFETQIDLPDDLVPQARRKVEIDGVYSVLAKLHDLERQIRYDSELALRGRHSRSDHRPHPRHGIIAWRTPVERTQRQGRSPMSTPGPNMSVATDTGTICTELARLPRTAHLDTDALARILSRHPKTVTRSVSRGELPAPFKFLGRNQWLAGTIQDHLSQLQTKALEAQSKYANRER